MRTTDDIAGGYFSGTGQEADRPAKALWIVRLTFQNPLDVWIGGPLGMATR